MKALAATSNTNIKTVLANNVNRLSSHHDLLLRIASIIGEDHIGRQVANQGKSNKRSFLNFN
jgi:predicted secreted protein